MKSVAWLRAVSIVVLATSCSADREPALRVGAAIRPIYEPMHLAQRLGKYETHKIKLIDFASSLEVIRAYRNGVVDVAAVTADEAFSIAASEHGKHKIILVAGFSNGTDSILAQPSYTRFEQLRDRRIGVEANAMGGYILSRALQKHGLTIRDVILVPVSADQQLAAFESGSVDAVVTFDPNRSSLLASGANEVFSSKELPGEVVDVIVTRAVLLANRRPALIHFLQGWFVGLKFLQQQLPEASLFAAQHERIAPDAFIGSLQGLQHADRERNLQMFALDSRVENVFQGVAERMRNTGLDAAPGDPLAPYGRLLSELPQ